MHVLGIRNAQAATAVLIITTFNDWRLWKQTNQFLLFFSLGFSGHKTLIFSLFLFLSCRRHRPERCGARRDVAGEVAVCPRRVLPLHLPRSANPLWKTATSPAHPPLHRRQDDRAALLCSSGGQDAHRDADQGDAPQRQLLHMAALCSVAVSNCKAAS